MTQRNIYLALCVLGLVLPYWHFVPWLWAHGLDVPLFLAELFSTPIGSFFGMDVIVSAGILALFILQEGGRLGMTRLWLPLAGTFLVGVSFGLPLFLAMRHHHQQLGSASVALDAAA